MASVKPRKSISAYGERPIGGVTRNTPPRPVAPPPKPPTQPAAPAAPALAAVPKIQSGPPPPTLQSGADRNSTNYAYGTTLGDVNSQLRSLAAQYGAAPQVTQYGYDATKGLGGDTQTALDVAPNQPGSTMEALMRNLGLTKGNIDDTNLAQNTFFGSRRVDQLGAADKQFSGDAAAAKRAYDDAVNALINGPGGILAARGTRNQNLTNADIADTQAAAATTPEPAAAAPYDPWNDPNVDWNAVKAAFGPQQPVPTLSAGGSQAQKKKPKKK